MSRKSFLEYLNEGTQLLLEYDENLTWKQHGKKIINRMIEDPDDHPLVQNVKNDHKNNRLEDHDELNKQTVMDHMAFSDPTSNKKYTQHIARIYGSGGVNRFEDLRARMHPALEKFDDLSKRKIIPAEHRDIGRIKSLGQLEDLVDAHADKMSGKEESKNIKSQATITDHDHFTHIIPHTHEAAKQYGKGTRWCTTQREFTPDEMEHFGTNHKSYYHMYTQDGPLQIFIPKNPRYDGEKYQYHYSTGQLMNPRDEDAHEHLASNGDHGIHNFVNQYRQEQEDLHDKPDALRSPEGATRFEYLSRHAKNDELITAARHGGNMDTMGVTNNDRFNWNHVRAGLDNPNVDARSNLFSNPPQSGEEMPKDVIDKALKDSHPTIVGKAMDYLGSENLSHDHIRELLNHKSSSVRIHAASHAVRNPENDDLIAEHPDVDVRWKGASSLKSSTNLLRKLAKDSDYRVARDAVMNENGYGRGVAPIGMKHDDDSVRNEAVAHLRYEPNAEEHQMKALDDPSHDVKWSLMTTPDLSHRVLHKAIEHGDVNVRKMAALHDNADSHVLDRALDDEAPGVRNYAAKNKNLQLHHIDRIFGEENIHKTGAPREVLKNRSVDHLVDSRHLDQAIDMPYKGAYNELVAKHPKATSDNLMKIINHAPGDKDAITALQNPNMMSHHLESIINGDHYSSVKAVAAQHPNLESHAIAKALQSDDKFIKYGAASNPSLGPEHEHLLSDEQKRVRDTAAKNRIKTHGPTHYYEEKLSFKNFITESQLLLEYDSETTWKQHGKKAVERAVNSYENKSDNHWIARDVHYNFNTRHDFQDPHAIHTRDIEGHQTINTANDSLRHHLEQTDPTPNKKYVQHVARIYGGGGVNRIEDLHSRMRPALAKFDDLAKRKIIPPEQRDIGRIKKLSDLEDIVDAHAEKMSGKEEDKAYHEKMKSEATITDHPDFTHIIPHTEAAANHFGKGTRWCTTSDAAGEMGAEGSYFSHYNREGPLHILTPKKPAYPTEKYQFHYSSAQFMNDRDEPVDSPTMFKHHARDSGYYGTSGVEAPKGIEDWVNKYNDSAEEASKNMQTALSHPDIAVSNKFISTGADEKGLHEYLKSKKNLTFDSAYQMSTNPNFNSSHVDAMLDHPSAEVRQLAAAKVSNRDQWLKAAHDKSDIVREFAWDHGLSGRTSYNYDANGNPDPYHVSYATPQDIDHVLKNEKYASIVEKAVKNSNVSADNLTDALNHPSMRSAAIAAIDNPKISDWHLHHAINHPDEDVAAHVVHRHGLRLDNEHIDSIVGRGGIPARILAQKNKLAGQKLTSDHIQTMIDKHFGDRDLMSNIASSELATHNQLHTLLGHSDADVRTAVMRAPGHDSTHLDRAVEDKNPRVTATAALSDKIEQRHVDRLIENNPSSSTIHNLTGIYGNGKAADMITPNHLSKILHPDNPYNLATYDLESLAGHKSHDDESIKVALNHPSYKVRQHALLRVGHNSWNTNRLDRAPLIHALNDKHKDVVHTAIGAMRTDDELHAAITHPSYHVRKTAYLTHKSDVYGNDEVFANPKPRESLIDKFDKVHDEIEHRNSKENNRISELKAQNKTPSEIRRHLDQEFPEETTVSFSEFINEVSNSLLHKYINRAKKSVKKKMDEPYSNHEDDKVFKRKMYISFAQHSLGEETETDKIRHPSEPRAYVQKIDKGYKASNKHGKIKLYNEHGKKSAHAHADIPLKEELEPLEEREDKTVSFRAAVHYRDTDKRGVRHRRNQRLRHMVDSNRTQYVMRVGFKPRSGNPNQLVDRQKHQLTDRWRNQRLVRLKLLRQNKNLKEDNQYLKNRQALHDAHAQAGREIGKTERDPELKRIHMHRAKKHGHAAKVLSILRGRNKKK